jgi:dTDP-4-dehydrorhamnose 3,5-epimerase
MNFSFKPTALPEVILVEPETVLDNRGRFMETYHELLLHQAGIRERFVQDNMSLSRLGVLRGLHFQEEPFAQSKLVRVSAGEIFDVAVDLRPGSSTFGTWVAERLSAENGRQLYIPAGFAHGFLALAENTAVHYKVHQYYSSPHERGIRWDDPELAIAWPLHGLEPVLSNKDRQWGTLEQWHKKQ